MKCHQGAGNSGVGKTIENRAHQLKRVSLHVAEQSDNENVSSAFQKCWMTTPLCLKFQNGHSYHQIEGGFISLQRNDAGLLKPLQKQSPIGAPNRISASMIG